MNINMTHSKLPWRKVTFPDGGSFIQADRNKPEDPYDIEIFGEDVNPNLYPQEQKDLDIDLTLRFVNNKDLIIQNLEAAWVVNRQFGVDNESLNHLLSLLKPQ